MLYNLPHTSLLDILPVLTSKSDPIKIIPMIYEINKRRIAAM